MPVEISRLTYVVCTQGVTMLPFDFLTAPFAQVAPVDPLSTLIRLIMALILGLVIAFIYKHTRSSASIAPTFPLTLTLLCVLIAIVTQVIGDNAARAFSLVGALSIVRFRTVVRDTQDTAYVIFAVITGMAVGAHNLWVAVLGIAVVGCASLWGKYRIMPDADPLYLLVVRMTNGQKANDVARDIMDSHMQNRKLIAVGTPRKGGPMEYTYEARLRPHASPADLMTQLHEIEGIQGAQLRRQDCNDF